MSQQYTFEDVFNHSSFDDPDKYRTTEMKRLMVTNYLAKNNMLIPTDIRTFNK